MMVMMVMKVNLLDIGKLGRREVGGCKQDTPGGPAPDDGEDEDDDANHVDDEDGVDGEEDEDDATSQESLKFTIEVTEIS